VPSQENEGQLQSTLLQSPLAVALPYLVCSQRRVHAVSNDVESNSALAAAHFTAWPCMIFHKINYQKSKRVTINLPMTPNCSQKFSHAALVTMPPIITMGYLNKNGPLIPPSTENTIVDQTSLKKIPSKENAPIYYVDYWQCSMQASPILLYQRF
jgi:hypothetical protein